MSDILPSLLSDIHNAVNSDKDAPTKSNESAVVTTSGTSPYDDHAFTLLFLVRQAMVGAIIGREGSNIKELRAQNSDANITVTPGFADGAAEWRLVAITGVRACVVKVYTGILKSMATIANNSNNSNHRISVKFLIPKSHMGAVIGKQGINITKIRQDSGGASVVAEKQGGYVYRLLEMSGDAHQLEIGLKTLLHVLETEMPDKLLLDIANVHQIQPHHFEYNHEKQQQARSSLQQRAQNVNMPTTRDVVMKMTVPSEAAIGKIIGKGGSKIQSMRQKSGANIHVDSKSREISISGTREQREMACELISETLELQETIPSIAD